MMITFDLGTSASDRAHIYLAQAFVSFGDILFGPSDAQRIRFGN
jgi:hypothetical protein